MPLAGLAEFIALERAADVSHAAWRNHEARRHSGVAWSGMAADSATPRTDQAVLAAARAKLADRYQWRESRQGQFVTAVAQAQLAARQAHAIAERARDAASRDFTDELSVCEAAARDLRVQALALLVSARRALRLTVHAPSQR